MTGFIPIDSPDHPRRAYSMVNFWPLIEPFLEGRVCEIGAERGCMTSRLATHPKVDHLSIIDPRPSRFVLALSGTTDKLQVIPKRSIEALPALLPCAVYLVDGDHNYHTVSRELELICGRNEGIDPIIFLHDTSWPFGDRDLYYDTDDIPPDELHPHTNKLGAEPGERYLVEGGRYLVAGERMAMSIDSGEGMGVGNAVRDFCSNSESHWNSLSIPVLNGLTVMWGQNYPRGADVAEVFDWCTPGSAQRSFMEQLEELRIELLLHCIQVESVMARRMR